MSSTIHQQLVQQEEVVGCDTVDSGSSSSSIPGPGQQLGTTTETPSPVMHDITIPASHTNTEPCLPAPAQIPTPSQTNGEQCESLTHTPVSSHVPKEKYRPPVPAKKPRKYTPVPAHTLTDPCQPGTYTPVPAHTLTDGDECSPPLGKIALKLLQNNTDGPCQPDTYTPIPAHTLTDPCQSGTFTRVRTHSLTDPCQPGTYTPVPTHTFTDPCLPGIYTTVPVQTLTDPCQLGTFTRVRTHSLTDPNTRTQVPAVTEQSQPVSHILAPSHTPTEQCESGIHTPEDTASGSTQVMGDDIGFQQEGDKLSLSENGDVTKTCHTDVNRIQVIDETPSLQQTASDDIHTEPHTQHHTENHAESHVDPHAEPHTKHHAESYTQPHAEPHTELHTQPHTEPHYLNDDQMPQTHRDSYQTMNAPTSLNQLPTPVVPYHMRPEIPPPYQSNPTTPEVPRGPCRFHQNMPSPYHSHPNTPGTHRVPCHRFTHTFEDDSYSLNSTLTSLEVGHLQLTARSPCQVASSSLESQFRLPINRRGLFLQDMVFERAGPVLQSALREVLGRGWGPGRHTTMADEMVRYRNMRAGDMDGRTQITVITRHDTYYLIVVDMHEYLEGSIQLKVGACCSVLVEGWLEIEDQDELLTYEFNRRFPTPDMAELKDISADLSSDGILSIIVPTIPLDDPTYGPGPQYNDSSYEPLVDVSLYSQNKISSSGRPGDNMNPRYDKYWKDSNPQDPANQPLVDVNTTPSIVKLEEPCRSNSVTRPSNRSHLFFVC